MINRLICISLIILVAFCTPLFATVRFAQISDPHIFEDSKRASDAKISAAEFSLSLKKVNQISKALTEKSKESLDFLLVTGDFGIGKLLKLEPATKGEKGLFIEKEGKRYIVTKDMEKWNQAKELLAHILQDSSVKKWLIVPGNNDLYDERSDTISFFRDFLKELQDMPEIRASGLSIVDFRLEATQKAQPQSPPGMYIIKDFLFVGWDNSFFKNNDSFAKFVAKDHKVIPIHKTDEYQSVQKLSQSLKTAKAKYAYIFYHIPEIDDPYMVTFDEKEEGNVVSKRLAEARDLSPSFAVDIYAYSAWTVPLEVRQLWENLAMNTSFKTPMIKGLFAGHFHDHKKETYETMRWLKSKNYQADILKKLYLCPPISIKHQEKYPPSDRAMGGQIITIDDNGEVSRDIFWLP